MGKLKVKEVAKELGITEGSVRASIRNGAMSGIKIKNKWYVEESEVDRYKKENLGKRGRRTADVSGWIDLYQKGKNDKQISEQLDVSYKTINNLRRKLSLPPNTGRDINRDYELTDKDEQEVKEVADRLCYSFGIGERLWS